MALRKRHQRKPGWLLAGCFMALAAVTSGCPSPVTPVRGTAPDDARQIAEVATRFVHATRSRDFETAYALLSHEHRARYTPKLLELDFDAEPLAAERLERLSLALGGPLTITGDLAQLPVGAGRAARFGREHGEWRLVALE